MTKYLPASLVALVLILAGFSAFQFFGVSRNLSDDTSMVSSIQVAERKPNPAPKTAVPAIEQQAEFVYTDEVENPYTGQKYFIRKPWDEGCGINGTPVCDLVVEKENGEKAFITSLLGDGERRLNGARLLGFPDAVTLSIGFATFDHGGGSSEVRLYNLQAFEMSEPIVVFSETEGMIGENYGSIAYSVCPKETCLDFINVVEAANVNIYSAAGVYMVKNNVAKAIKHPFSLPVTVEFDLRKNDQVLDTAMMVVNGVLYSFDFSTRIFTIVNDATSTE